MASKAKVSAVVFLGLISPAALGADDPAGQTKSPAFVDVTTASGVAEVLATHYRRVPKWWLSGMALLDLDGDGDLDIHLAGHGSPAAAALNDGKGRFTGIDPHLGLKRGVRYDNDIPYPGGEIRLSFDFDEDGRLDLLTSWHDGGGVLYLNDFRRGPRGIRANFRRSRHLAEFCRGCAVFDVDRDGVADFLRDDGKQIAVFHGKGDGSFRPERGAIAGSFEQSGFIPADLNGDGHIDLLMHGRTEGNFYSRAPFERRILRNNGRGGFADATSESGLDRRGGSIHGVGDVNHDGHPDLICVESRLVRIHLNDGRGRFRRVDAAVGGLEDVRARPSALAWGGAIVTDFDNDGKADVVVAGRYFLYVLRGRGDGTFTYANSVWGLPNTAWAAVDEGLCFGDIDADGRLDLLTCATRPNGKQKGVRVMRNNLPRRHWLRVRLVGAKGNRSAAGAKIRIHAPASGGKRRLLWYEQVSIWGRQSCHSYYAAAQTERHFGLGRHKRVDVSVEFHPSGKRVERRGVPADRTIEIEERSTPRPHVTTRQLSRSAHAAECGPPR